MTDSVPKRPTAGWSPWLLLALLTLPLAACERRGREAATLESVTEEGGPSSESWNARLLRLDGSRPRVELAAPYVAQYERGDSAFTLLRQDPAGRYASSDARVRIQLFDTTGAPSAVVTADEVRYHEEDGRFEARGGTHVVTEEGKTLRTELLVWHEAQREVRAPGFVEIVTPDETERGTGLVADEDLATYRLSRVSGEVYRDEDE